MHRFLANLLLAGSDNRVLCMESVAWRDFKH